jgi:hypothetical protein
MNLPIDIIPNTAPPKFHWRQTVNTPVGARTVEYDGELPATVEQAVVDLIGIAKQLAAENEALRLEKASLDLVERANRGEQLIEHLQGEVRDIKRLNDSLIAERNEAVEQLEVMRQQAAVTEGVEKLSDPIDHRVKALPSKKARG